MSIFSKENNICSHRHSFTLDNFFRRLIQSPKKIMTPYINLGDTVIDLGCGPGFFTLPMLDMVGDTGNVVAVDVQSEMLEKVQQKLPASSLAKRVQLHQCSADTLGLEGSVQADFILAYYMVHETPNQEVLFRELKGILKKGGKILVVEPPLHVSKSAFLKSLEIAQGEGFSIFDTPKGKGGMSMLLSHS